MKYNKKTCYQKEITYKEVLLHIFSSIRTFYIPIFIMFLVSCIYSIDLSVRPYLLKLIINKISEQAEGDIFQIVMLPMLMYIFMYLIMTSAHRLYGYFVEIKMIPSLRATVAKKAFSTFLTRSYHYYQNCFPGNLGNKVNDLAMSTPEILQILIDKFFCNILALIIATYSLCQVSYLFACFIFIWTVIFIFISYLFSVRLSKLANDWFKNISFTTGNIVDVFSNVLHVKLFCSENKEKDLFVKLFTNVTNSEQKLQWLYFWMWSIFSYSFCILQIFNLFFLLKGKQDGWISIGDFALVLIINISLIDSLWKLTKDFSQFAQVYGRIKQALEPMMNLYEISDKKESKILKVYQGKITFQKVTFNYENYNNLFEKESVTILPKQKVGIVGFSGAGKSTFIKLLLRFYDVKFGQITIDNQNIKNVTRKSLYNSISVIPQEHMLFHRTILENIKYGNDTATDEEAIQAAKLAYAHEFISHFPKGYKTLVGERGINLSGGQRQQIFIARAFLKKASILIFDEATSNLDSVTEKKIQKSLVKLMKGKTTIVIAHRMSTLMEMERILVFEKGKIVQDGTHQELINNKGPYRVLWNTQTKV